MAPAGVEIYVPAICPGEIQTQMNFEMNVALERAPEPVRKVYEAGLLTDEALNAACDPALAPATATAIGRVMAVVIDKLVPILSLREPEVQAQDRSKVSNRVLELSAAPVAVESVANGAPAAPVADDSDSASRPERPDTPFAGAANTTPNIMTSTNGVVARVAAPTSPATSIGAPTGDLHVVLADDLPDAGPEDAWLIDQIWSGQGVGIIGGPPKGLKTWIGLELVVAVASHTPFLGSYSTCSSGRVLAFLAEDSLAQVKVRLRALCAHRDLRLRDLDIRIITKPKLLLDDPHDFHWLENQVRALRPKLLLLDPLVRIFRGDEDDAGSISRLLGLLRKLQKEYQCAVALVHHAKKTGMLSGGASLRGSGDLHAWGDSNVYLTPGGGGARVVVEHRGARAPDPFRIRLHVDGGPGTEHLVREEGEPEAAATATPAHEQTLEYRIVAILSKGSLGHGKLRERLGVQGQALSNEMRRLKNAGTVVKERKKWCLIRSLPTSPLGKGPERNGKEPSVGTANSAQESGDDEGPGPPKHGAATS